LNQSPRPNEGRRVSPAGVAFIRAEEGCVLRPYKDQVGKWTIGVGHLIQPGESFGESITQEQADALLARDLDRFERAIWDRVPVALTGNQFDATASFAFNCGTGVLINSTFMRALVCGDFKGAADGMLLWTKGPSGVELPVLRRRRARERALFLKPDEPLAVT
jgi:lysozyme